MFKQSIHITFSILILLTLLYLLFAFVISFSSFIFLSFDKFSVLKWWMLISLVEFWFYSFPVSVLLGIPPASPCICTLIGFALATLSHFPCVYIALSPINMYNAYTNREACICVDGARVHIRTRCIEFHKNHFPSPTIVTILCSTNFDKASE